MGIFADYRNRRRIAMQPRRISSGAMILEDKDGRALTVKSGYKPHWTFPGGIIDAGETPKEAAIRETFEEIGVRVDPKNVEFVAVINRRSDYADTYQFLFKADLPSGALDNIKLQPEEIDEYAMITKAQAGTNDRYYGEAIKHWVAGRSGYLEQIFEKASA